MLVALLRGDVYTGYSLSPDPYRQRKIWNAGFALPTEAVCSDQ